jgi:hypothetical protein
MIPPHRNPEAGEAAAKELTSYAAQLTGEGRQELYQALMLLQRRFFYLANRLSFIDLEELYEAYRVGYRNLEDQLYQLDMEPGGTQASVPEEETDTYQVLLHQDAPKVPPQRTKASP